MSFFWAPSAVGQAQWEKSNFKQAAAKRRANEKRMQKIAGRQASPEESPINFGDWATGQTARGAKKSPEESPEKPTTVQSMHMSTEANAKIQRFSCKRVSVEM